MDRSATYPYVGQQSTSPPTQRYSATSSAFSASAQPNEDWTKISDLAERRRIQNRIAQRNYRKKLKKRLEDLERRAASHSASPEQSPAELEVPVKQRRHSHQSVSQSVKDSTEYYQSAQQSSLYSTPEDRSMFTQQYTRQLSTSPPPFSYSPYPAETATFETYPQLPSLPASCADMPLFASYVAAPLPSPGYMHLPQQNMVYQPHVKQETYYEENINPFNATFATMAGINVTAANAYLDSKPQTPPMLEFFEHSAADTPPESSHFPATPPMLAATPNLLLADDILNSL